MRRGYVYTIMAVMFITAICPTISGASPKRPDLTEHRIRFTAPSTLSCTSPWVPKGKYFQVSIAYKTQGGGWVSAAKAVVSSGGIIRTSIGQVIVIDKPDTTGHDGGKDHTIGIKHIGATDIRYVGGKEFTGHPTAINVNVNCNITVTTE